MWNVYACLNVTTLIYSLPLLTLPTVNPLFQDEPSANRPAAPRHWISDHELMDGAVETIREEETVFWKELIQTYLYPIEGDKKEQEKTQAELIELR